MILPAVLGEHAEDDLDVGYRNIFKFFVHSETSEAPPVFKLTEHQCQVLR